MASVVISGDTSGAITISAPAVAGTNTLTLPVATDTLVGKTTTDTLTNKTLTSPTLTTPALGTPASGVLTSCTGVNYDGYKNRIINGAMVIDQRNAGASVTVNSSTATYPVDRFAGRGVSSAGVFTAQQSSTAPTGFNNSVVCTVTTSATPASTDAYLFRQNIEGYNVADLGFGAAGASTVTLSFWVRSSLTGTFGGAIQNDAFNRFYPFSYTISSANTFEYKTVTITGDTSGTWLKTNGNGMTVSFSLGAGSSRVNTAGTWTSSTSEGATGQTNLISTNGATFYITGVQLEKGSTATSFDYRSYGTELQLCQRYYWKNLASSTYSQLGMTCLTPNTTTTVGYPNLPVVMRSTPSVTVSNVRMVDSVTGLAVTAVSVTQNSAITPEVSFTVSGATQYRVYTLQANNNASAYIDYSAEL